MTIFMFVKTPKYSINYNIKEQSVISTMWDAQSIPLNPV